MPEGNAGDAGAITALSLGNPSLVGDALWQGCLPSVVVQVQASCQSGVAQTTVPLFGRSEASVCHDQRLFAQFGKHRSSSNICAIPGRLWISVRGWMIALACSGAGRKARALPVCLISLPGFPCLVSFAFLARRLRLKPQMVAGSRDARAGEVLEVTGRWQPLGLRS